MIVKSDKNRDKRLPISLLQFTSQRMQESITKGAAQGSYCVIHGVGVNLSLPE